MAKRRVGRYPKTYTQMEDGQNYRHAADCKVSMQVHDSSLSFPIGFGSSTAAILP